MAFRMRWPTQYGTLTQAFRARPDVYQKFGLPGHEGLDFQAPQGSEIYAVADGVVKEVRLDGNRDPLGKPYGNQVRVQHADGFLSLYAHLLDVCVTSGQAVQAGQLLGRADSTGNSEGDHLHLTLKLAGATAAGKTDYPYDIIDPTPYLEPFTGGAPVRPTPPAQTTLRVQVVSPDVGTLNVRNAPYVSADLVTCVADGAFVGALEPADVARNKVGEYGQWLWIRTAANEVGYVAAWYLRLPDSPAPDTEPALTLIVESPEVPLKVRAGAGTQYTIVAMAADATSLTALETPAAVRLKVGQHGSWLRVRTPSGLEGYTAAWYVRLASVSPEAKAVSALAVAASPAEERHLVRPDDLRLIYGLGPKAAALLQSVRIAVFEQVAALQPAQLRALLAEAGLRGQYVSTWPEQARLLSAGRLDELTALKARLAPGRADR